MDSEFILMFVIEQKYSIQMSCDCFHAIEREAGGFVE